MGETEQKMSEHPSISFLKEKHAKPKSEQNLTTEAVEKLLKTYEEKLTQACDKVKILPMGYVDTQMLSETITEAVEGYRQTIKELFDLTLESADSDKKWQLTEIKQLAEQANNEIITLLNQILSLLEKLGANADLERSVLEKLNVELSR